MYEFHQPAGVRQVEKRGYICTYVGIHTAFYDPRLCTVLVRTVLAKSAGGLLGETGALQHVQGPDGRQRAIDRVDI